MTAFTRFSTRFSISPLAPAKVAKPAKVDAGAAKLSQLSQVSQPPVSKTKNPQAPSALALTAARIAASIAEGAEREDDADGWLVLVLQDGRRHIPAPHIVAALNAAGLLPDLPPARSRSGRASSARPPSWSDPQDRPRHGDRCCVCRLGRWWTAAPTPDGWCCATCHPPSLGRAVTNIET